MEPVHACAKTGGLVQHAKKNYAKIVSVNVPTVCANVVQTSKDLNVIMVRGVPLSTALTPIAVAMVAATCMPMPVSTVAALLVLVPVRLVSVAYRAKN